MRTREVTVTGRTIAANGDNTLIRTSVGVDQLHVLFDASEWLTLANVHATFKHGSTMISTALTLTAVDSLEWSAEATCIIPWEVMQTTGDVELTFQATDSETGEHIITQDTGGILQVVDEGEVDPSTLPSPSPTPPDLPIATTTSLGAVMPDGTTITIDQDGTIHGASTYTLPIASTSTLGGVKVDGTTITADVDGTLHGATSVNIGEITDAEIHAITGNSATYAYNGEGVRF